jgi:hypothetical protein
MEKLDKRNALVLLFLLLAVSLQAQTNDARDDAYAEWVMLSKGEQRAFATGAISGAAFAFFILQNSYEEAKFLRNPYLLIPLGWTNLQLVALVDEVYRDPKKRSIPYIGIMLLPGKYYKGD